ncbi:MAG TPA: nucleotidyltransferase domain-containing protein [Pyrinomonadaceae bacterium]|jgi:arginine-tRNA-protein transferase
MSSDENIIFVDDTDEEYIDHDEFETIFNHRRVFEDTNIDAFLANGWCYNLDRELVRYDSESFDGRLWRTFPTRYRLKDFVLSKSLRRVLKKNADLKVHIRPLWVTRQKSALYEKHYTRYNEKLYQTLAQKYPIWKCDSEELMEVCVLKNRRVVACSIFDNFPKSIQSDSCFWDLNEPQRSLGIFTVLLEMQYAIKKKKDFYYLGHYYKQNPNFQYKLRFPGLEFYDWDNEAWVDKKDAGKLLDQRLRRMEFLPPFNYEDLCLMLALPVYRFPEVVGVALFGSRARGTERPDSDVDVLLLTPDIEKHFENDGYITSFGRFQYARREKWFSGETIRSFYREQHGQIEFNFVTPGWADLPASDEVRRIVGNGMRILHDPQGILEKLQNAVSE